MQRNRLFLFVNAALAALLPLAGEAAAQSTSDPASVQATTLDNVRVLGSRRMDRSSDTQSPVPVDVIPMERIAEQGAQFDLAQTLQYTAPSLISTRQTGADGADLVDGAALRGLGSDQTLVLINGKRRHTVSLVNIYGARDRGNTGTDLNSLPMLAIERVEVLRDGAAAQYGSDAIAGVMNIALKRRPGCEAIAGWGQYSRGDGQNWIASAYCGLSLSTGGHFAVTGEWQDRDRSNRATAENPLRTIGDSRVKNKTLYLNGDIPLGEVAEFYFTAGMQSRDASSAAYARGGIGTEDIPSRNSVAMYPNGFVPYINGDLQDRYSIAGLRGDAGQWHWDLSHTYGSNELRYTIDNTLNASIAHLDQLNGGSGLSPRRFDAGGFSFAQNTVNADVSRYFDNVFNGLNLALGAEHRREQYRIRAGEPGSYQDVDGAGVGGNPGSQGFPGFQPSDATRKSRNSWAAYVDLEMDLSQRFMLGVAGRYENYSDFGNTFNGKLAAAFRVTDAFLLRGSLSTGFRAPSLQQKYFSSTITDFINARPVDVMIAPNGGKLANLAGIPELKEETSRGGTLGFTWSPTDAVTVTLDAYRIQIKDRVILSGEFDTNDPAIGAILQGMDVGLARFFFNAVDTRTTGVDLTLAWNRSLGAGKLATYLAANYGKTQVTGVNTPAALVGRQDVLLPPRDRLFVENGAPRGKAVLGLDYSLARWDIGMKVIHFGRQTLGTFSGPPVPDQRYSPKTSLDLSLTYAFTENAKLTVGGSNLLDVFPSRQDPNETDNGHIYESVQFGLNGAAYFARFWYRF